MPGGNDVTYNPWADNSASENRIEPVRERDSAPGNNSTIREPGRQDVIELTEIRRPKRHRQSRILAAESGESTALAHNEHGGQATECIICTYGIFNTTPIWTCIRCQQVFHFSCIRSWANSKRWPWKCPTCNAKNNIEPDARCWCGAQRYNWVDRTGNACGGKCAKLAKCDCPAPIKCLRRCSKVCHQGPCSFPDCSAQCLCTVQMQVAVDTTADWVAQQITLRHTTTPALVSDERDSDSVLNSGANTTCSRGRICFWRLVRAPHLFQNASLSIIQSIALWFIITKHIPWWTQPLKYSFVTNEMTMMYECLFAFIIWTLLAIACIVLFSDWAHIYRALFRIRGPSSIKNWIARHCIGLSLYTIAITAIVWPYALLVHGPGLELARQMKHSCDGFDARVILDDKSGKPKRTINLFDPRYEASEFEHRELGINAFKLYPQFISSTNSTFGANRTISTDSSATLPYSFRMAGRVIPEKETVVDFDFANHQWRILERNSTTNSSHAQTRNGTWSYSNDGSSHISFDGLNLMAPNLGLYMRNCQYQHFMTIYRTDNMTQEQTDAQNGREWSSKSESNVVMRTANFERNIHRLQVCAKSRDTFGSQKMGDGVTVPQTVKRLEDDMIVVLGWLAATRKVLEMQGQYKKSCNWGGSSDFVPLEEGLGSS